MSYKSTLANGSSYTILNEFTKVKPAMEGCRWVFLFFDFQLLKWLKRAETV